MFTLDRSKNDTSIAIDALRAAAAQMVCVGHAISFFVAEWHPKRLAYPQNVGVLIFFLLSGFLIAHTLIQKSKDPNYGFIEFSIERFARIYSGLIPALLLVAIVDGFTIYLTNDPNIRRYYTWDTLLANLLMLENYRGIFPNLSRWSAFGSASPLWTLAVEWHIYIFVGALFFMVRRPKWIPLLLPIAVIFGQNPLHYLFGSLQADGVGFALFALWLAGAAVYFSDRLPIARFFPAAAIGLGATIAFVITTRTGAEYRLQAYVLLLAAFFSLIATTQSVHVIRSPRVLKSIRFAADYSFSLYLVHHTIMYAVFVIFPARGIGPFFAVILASNLMAIAVAELGEKRHRSLTHFLMNTLHRHSIRTDGSTG